MGRASIKKNKNLYQIAREDLGLTREHASELLGVISADRIEKIESEKVVPHPDEILLMAKKYKRPELSSYFCSKECEIGRKYHPIVEEKELSSIVLELLASLSSLEKQRDLLISITSDGIISDDEIPALVSIENHLSDVSRASQALKLWCEKKIASKDLAESLYEYHKRAQEK